MTKLFTLVLALGLVAGACVSEDETTPPPPTDEEGEVEESEVPEDPPGETLPDPGGAPCTAQLKADGACTP